MADYKQQTTEGTLWQRAKAVHIINEYNGTKYITFDEEQVILLGGEVIRQQKASVGQSLTPENALTTFPLINPETNQPIVDGNGDPVTSKYQDVYVLLFSLYYDLAQKRDAGVL